MEDEAASGTQNAALAQLSTNWVPREVDAKGVISLGNRSRDVGVALKGRRVYLSRDPYPMEWLVQDQDGVCFPRLKVQELTTERIVGWRSPTTGSVRHAAANHHDKIAGSASCRVTRSDTTETAQGVRCCACSGASAAPGEKLTM